MIRLRIGNKIYKLKNSLNLNFYKQLASLLCRFKTYRNGIWYVWHTIPNALQMFGLVLTSDETLVSTSYTSLKEMYEVAKDINAYFIAVYGSVDNVRIEKVYEYNSRFLKITVTKILPELEIRAKGLFNPRDVLDKTFDIRGIGILCQKPYIHREEEITERLWNVAYAIPITPITYLPRDSYNFEYEWSIYFEIQTA